MMVFMIGSYKRKYGELIHNFSIQYLIKNNQYTKTLQEAVYVMLKLKFKSENNNDESNAQNRIKMKLAREINKTRKGLNKHINMKKGLLMWFSNAHIK